MRKTLLIISLLGILIQPAQADKIDGAWVFHECWFMGMALVIKGDGFSYWFRSDVEDKDGPNYPIKGKIEFDGDRVRLLLPKLPPYYDKFIETEWHLVIFQGQICLLGQKYFDEYSRTKKMTHDRLLFRFEGFDENKPALNLPHKDQNAEPGAAANSHPR